MNIDLANRSAIVTGGSKGIGYAIATRFAASGANVMIAARGREALDAAVKSIGGSAKGRVAGVQSDVGVADGIKQIYDEAVANVKSGKASLVGTTVEAKLRQGNENVFDPSNPDSPSPLPGDMVIFKEAATHVAIATGTVTAGKHEVISLWNQPGNISTVQRTSIEDLLAVVGSSGRPVKFWSANW